MVIKKDTMTARSSGPQWCRGIRVAQLNMDRSKNVGGRIAAKCDGKRDTSDGSQEPYVTSQYKGGGFGMGSKVITGEAGMGCDCLGPRSGMREDNGVIKQSLRDARNTAKTAREHLPCKHVLPV